MTFDLSINLQRDASAATVARRAAEQLFADGLGRRRISDLALVVSELVTNAIVHGRGAITLKLQRDGELVRGEVVDQGGGFEREIRERGPDDVGGRGLMIVESLSSRWGVYEGTTHVWFELDPGATDVELTEPELGEPAF
ncbi:MAG: serine/threonine-protein kinase RsbW [Solirubrobacteraceae bacterium]|nr:serine/threonine-protein kinase RsbW [Solirubrobacteraceae bacterium]